MLRQGTVAELHGELRADRCNFVQLPWSVLRQEMQAVTDVRTCLCASCTTWQVRASDAAAAVAALPGSHQH